MYKTITKASNSSWADISRQLYGTPDRASNLEKLNNNTSNGQIMVQDGTARISQPGEKRIYSTNPTNTEITASIHLKNTGEIEIETKTTININSATIYKGER